MSDVWDSICGECGRVKPCACDALPTVTESTRTMVVNQRNYHGQGQEIGRHTPFGNPHKTGTREENIAAFRHYFHDRIRWDRAFRALVLTLRGEILVCSCKPLPCHGDVIAEWLDAQPGP
jgi:hypothetical protein